MLRQGLAYVNIGEALASMWENRYAKAPPPLARGGAFVELRVVLGWPYLVRDISQKQRNWLAWTALVSGELRLVSHRFLLLQEPIQLNRRSRYFSEAMH